MSAPRPLRIAALVKQIPKFEEMRLGPDGRLLREGVPLEMNAYCRRAVGKGVELARESGGSCTVLTLGPPSADDVLREAIAWGADDGVLVTDPAFAGSDTYATARALASALEREGPFDLVLAGRNSVDADTGQVGPEVAELLDLPFAGGVRELEVDGDRLHLRCEHDDEWVEVRVSLPAVLSVAERLCEPSKVPPEGRAEVPAERIRTVSAADLGPGPWGQDASPTVVGETRLLEVERLGLRLEGSPEEMADKAVAVLLDRGALDDHPHTHLHDAPAARPGALDGPAVAVVVEPDRARLTRELLGAAARLASEIGGGVVAVGHEPGDPTVLASWGADAVVDLHGALVEEDVASALSAWASDRRPWAILAPGTLWGREVASRAAASLAAGLTGDAVGLAEEDGRLVAWKPAFGGRLVAAIATRSAVQMATVRAGVLPLPAPRTDATAAPVERIDVTPRGRVEVVERVRDDDIDALANAEAVVGLGTGVLPEEYDEVRAFAQLLGGELAATRKVTDKGWLPRARQVGITGHSISPRLYVALGLSGKFNHTVGVRSAGTILAVNTDPDALIFDWADISMVGDWHEVLPALAARLEVALAAKGKGTA